MTSVGGAQFAFRERVSRSPKPRAQRRTSSTRISSLTSVRHRQAAPREWAKLAVAALTLTACGQADDAPSDRPIANLRGTKVHEASGSPDTPSREAKYELYQKRFRQARDDPRLIRGKMIAGATVKCETMQIWDDQTGRALILRALSPDGGHFRFHLGDNVMVGDVDPLWSEDERIFLLSGLQVARGSFDGDPLRPIADLIETLQNTCTAGRTRHIPSFVLLEETEASRG